MTEHRIRLTPAELAELDAGDEVTVQMYDGQHVDIVLTPPDDFPTETPEEREAREIAYRRGEAAKAEVIRRLGRAVDRLNVALSFRSADQAVLAQGLHAIHFLELGGTGTDVPPMDAPDFHVSHRDAEELALLLASMLSSARRADSTVYESGVEA